ERQLPLHEPDAHMRRSHPHVTGHCKLTTTTQRIAIERRDDGNGEAPDAVEGGTRRTREPIELLGAPQRLELAQVSTGCERAAARRRQDCECYGVVTCRGEESLAERLQRLATQRVALLRTIDLDQQEAADPLADDEGCHAAASMP